MKYFVAQWRAIVCGLVVCAATPALAERPASVSSLIDQVRSLSRAYQPVGGDDVRAAQRRAQAAAEALDLWLGERDARVRAAWHALLDWRILEEQLTSVSPDVAVLRAAGKKLSQNIAGLERAQFRELRDRLVELVDAVELVANPVQRDQWHARVEQLELQLARYAHEPNGEDSLAIGHALDRLQRHGEVGKQVAAAVRREYDKPNGYGQFSGRLLKEFVNIDIDQSEMISETILGSVSQGLVSTRGKVRVELSPDPRHASIEFRMTGTANSDHTVSQNGPATVYSRSQTTIDARKLLLADGSGLAAQPARAECNTQITIDDIDTRWRAINRLAWRQADKLHPQAQSAASERASRRVEEQLDKQTAGPLRKANQIYLDHFCNPLLRQGALPAFSMSTTSEHLRISVLERNSTQLGAPSAAPGLSPEHDMALVFHESIVANTSELMLAGKLCSDKVFMGTIELLSGEAPRQLWVHDRSEPWSARFAKSRPISTKFSGDTVELTLRFAELNRGTMTTNVPVTVRATYSLEITPDGPKLSRRGEVSIAAGCSEAASLGELPAEFQQLAFEKFTALFPPTVFFDGLVPPNGGTWGILRKLALRQFTARDGWLTIAYQLPAKQQPAALATSGAPAAQPANRDAAVPSAN